MVARMATALHIKSNTRSMLVNLMCVTERYMNEQPAPSISPRATFTSIAVIARFVAMDGSETWVPGVAVRWSSTVVMVGVGGTFAKTYTWLPAADVTRMIRPAGGHASW